MSPASQGGVEVERYIGSCLISSLRAGSHRPLAKKQEVVIRGKTRSCYSGQSFGANGEQCQVQYNPSGWTGAPLISMTSSPRRSNQRSSPPLLQQACEQAASQLHKNPLSRLAIHTQGAPLILAGRFHNRGKTNASSSAGGSYAPSSAERCPSSRQQRPAELAKKQQAAKSECSAGKEAPGGSIANIDSLSIASDESSGSNNSENSLPRIIKPRKRRKKDRKPVNNAAGSPDASKHEEQQQQQIVEQPSVVALKPYAPGGFEPRFESSPAHLRNHRRPPVARESALFGCRAQPTAVHELADVRQRFAHRHVEVKVLDDNRNVVQARAKGLRPGGTPRYEYSSLASCEEGLGPCQCRYCDPSGLIWDVEQRCYSPFLTPAPSGELCPSRFPRAALLFSQPALARHERLFVDRDSCAGVVLRRSWSDPSSYFSEEIAAPSKDVGVIGDRGHPRALWRGDTMGIPASSALRTHEGISDTLAAPKGLEVSTEIVTSPNGHRDLEIKFYSPSPNAPAPEEEKIGLEDEDEEDLSDFWSYHDSKLQQDFRTLLQAEE